MFLLDRLQPDLMEPRPNLEDTECMEQTIHMKKLDWMARKTALFSWRYGINTDPASTIRNTKKLLSDYRIAFP